MILYKKQKNKFFKTTSQLCGVNSLSMMKQKEKQTINLSNALRKTVLITADSISEFAIKLFLHEITELVSRVTQ